MKLSTDHFHFLKCTKAAVQSSSGPVTVTATPALNQTRMSDPPEELYFHISAAPATDTCSLSEILTDVLCSSKPEQLR